MVACRLIVALLCLFLPTGALSDQWKAIACTVENPETMRGTVLTIYFSDAGQVRMKDTDYPATITSAEIDFCFPIGEGKSCYTISRISGRFSVLAVGGVVGVVKGSGSCVPEGQQPKF